MFIANERLDRLTPTRLTGAADLVADVISPDNRGCDRSDRFYEYQAAGVGEYWPTDPDMRRTECYQLEDTGAVDAAGIRRDERVRARVMYGLWIDVARSRRDPPPLNRVLLAIAGERYAESMRADLEGGAFPAGSAGS